jgi:aspartyl-tRNA(Asn)/glutamyl-tRNA(Gln) amidotransferase subunit B
MELVTDPVMHSAEEAGRFARELQLLLRYLGASEANMEKGEMRVEANVSVARKGEMSKAYVEIKNLNSFRTMEKAVEYEIRRQTKMLIEGGVLEKQTLGWDENKGCTFPQRSKEGSADYRYFPDPDLPSIRISEISEMGEGSLVASLPELPQARRDRYIAAGIRTEDAEMYVRNIQLGDYADAVFAWLSDRALAPLASNYISNDLANKLSDIGSRDSSKNKEISPSVSNFCELIRLIGAKKISSRAAKDMLAELWVKDQDPRKLAEEKGLLAEVDSGKISAVVDEVIRANESVVADYRMGKQAALEYLLGQCMKALRGAGDPVSLRSALRTALEKA